MRGIAKCRGWISWHDAQFINDINYTFHRNDINDKIPEAIKNANGNIIRFGMPVDPGNLLLLGKIKKIPIIGLPGCARSPSLNGFDWVLERVLSGNNISDIDISNMFLISRLKY